MKKQWTIELRDEDGTVVKTVTTITSDSGDAFMAMLKAGVENSRVEYKAMRWTDVKDVE